MAHAILLTGQACSQKKEDAERYKELLEERFGADSEAFIEECEVDDSENEFI